ncbi:MAG: UbiD family decarboxylase [Deltaproteobacteria bacterium]|nr:UbiD family decarboxylase [Deltaproteobacteria bacterium]
MRGLREFLAFLEAEHPEEVVRIRQPIDPKACEATGFQEYLARRRRYPWLVFERVIGVDGSPWPGFFATYANTSIRRIAIAFGLDPSKCTPADVARKHADALRRPSSPRLVARTEAPVKEVVWRGGEASLAPLPFFRNAEKDSGPGWITPMYVARDPEDGRYNLSWHRGQYVDAHHMTARFVQGGHFHQFFQKARAAGKPLPCVAVVGHHPVFCDACGTNFPASVDEYEAVSGVYQACTGEPLRVAPSELWGDELLVPADAEIVLEGYMLDQYQEAGPWSDFWWSYLPPQRMNQFRVEAITMRREPIFLSVWPPTEVEINYTSVVLDLLRSAYPSVRKVHLPFPQTLIISYRPSAPGEPFHLAASLFRLGPEYVKNIIVVDEDVDPFDLEQVFFSLATRVDARKRVQVVPVMSHWNDPSATEETVGGLIIDATRPSLDPRFEIGKPPAAAIERAAAYFSEEVLARIPMGSRFNW